jgi:hypothetical protein
MPSAIVPVPHTRVVVGVDVSVRRGLDVVVLDDMARIAEARSHLGPDELGKLLERWRPAAVAIDSPPGPGRDPGATSRACERQMRELGVNIFLTPSDPEKFAGSFYDWIRVGTQAFAAAAAVGYPPQDDPAVVRGRALEVSPTPAMHSFEAFSHHPRRLEESPASELGGWRHCNPLACRPADCVSTELVSPLWIPSTRRSPRLRRAGPSTVRSACWATRASGSWCREPFQPGSCGTR